MSRSLMVALACALSSSATAATLTASDLASARSQASAAKAGDHVQLKSGTYALNLWNIVRTSPVVIEPAPGAAVHVTEINANGSAFLTFRGLTVTGTGVEVATAHDITLDGLKIQGDCSKIGGAGVWLRNLPTRSNVVIKNSTISCVRTGIGGLDFDGLTVERNTLHDIQTDGMLFTGVTNVVVRDNTGRDFHPAEGDHPDFIQFASTADTATAHVVVSGNRYERGSGGLSQGIFVEDGVDFIITDNELRGTMYNGIALARTKGAVITGNFLQAYPDMTTWIMVRQQADDVRIEGNAAPSVSVGVPNEPHPTRVTKKDNVITRAAGPEDETQYATWVSRRGKATP